MIAEQRGEEYECEVLEDLLHVEKMFTNARNILNALGTAQNGANPLTLVARGAAGSTYRRWPTLDRRV